MSGLGAGKERVVFNPAPGAREPCALCYLMRTVKETLPEVPAGIEPVSVQLT